MENKTTAPDKSIRLHQLGSRHAPARCILAQGNDRTTALDGTPLGTRRQSTRRNQLGTRQPSAATYILHKSAAPHNTICYHART